MKFSTQNYDRYGPARKMDKNVDNGDWDMVIALGAKSLIKWTAQIAKAQKKENERWLVVQRVAIKVAEPPFFAPRGGFPKGSLGVAELPQ